MYWNSLMVEYLVEQRLAEARATSARWRLLRSLHRPRRSPRVIVGAWLVGFGQRLLRSVPLDDPPSPAEERALVRSRALAVSGYERKGKRAA